MKPITTLVKISLFSIMAVAMGACASIPTHELSEAEIRTFNLTEVKVATVPNPQIKWGRFTREQKRIAESKPLDGVSKTETKNAYLLAADSEETAEVLGDTKRQPVAYTENAQTLHQTKMLHSPFEVALSEKFDKFMVGDRPVKVEITIKEVVIPSAAQTLLVGGKPYVTADFTLIDVNTNTVIALYPNITTFGGVPGLGGGLLETAINHGRERNKYEVVVHNMARQIGFWLIPTKDDDEDDATI